MGGDLSRLRHLARWAYTYGVRWRAIFLLGALLPSCSETPVERVFPASPVPVVDASDAHADAPVVPDTGAPDAQAPCPVDMVALDSFCIDRFEAYVVEIDALNVEREHSPYARIDGLRVRAKAAAKHVPQGYISQVEAVSACNEAGKRLCSKSEFSRACRGKDGQRYYPYGGTSKKQGVCNEGKGSTVARLFGGDSSAWTYSNFNDPRLNQLSNTLAASGEYAGCVTDEGVYDLVGNLHEWASDVPDAKGHGRFRGGFYGDAEVNGHGCLYETTAHEPSYHDYSTGFRCCVDALAP